MKDGRLAIGINVADDDRRAELPGVGPSRYQPVASAGSAAGVSMLPSAARPTLTTLARTPSDGIEIRVGMDGLNPSVSRSRWSHPRWCRDGYPRRSRGREG